MAKPHVDPVEHALTAETPDWNLDLSNAPPTNIEHVANRKAARGIAGISDAERGIAAAEPIRDFRDAWSREVANTEGSRQFMSAWDEALAEERAAQQANFGQQWDAAIAEGKADQWAGAAAARRAETVGFQPDPTRAAEFRPPTPPPPGAKFVERGFVAQRAPSQGDDWAGLIAEEKGRAEVPSSPVAPDFADDWLHEVRSAQGAEKDAALQRALDSIFNGNERAASDPFGAAPPPAAVPRDPMPSAAPAMGDAVDDEVHRVLTSGREPSAPAPRPAATPLPTESPAFMPSEPSAGPRPMPLPTPEKQAMDALEATENAPHATPPTAPVAPPAQGAANAPDYAPVDMPGVREIPSQGSLPEASRAMTPEPRGVAPAFVEKMRALDPAARNRMLLSLPDEVADEVRAALNEPIVSSAPGGRYGNDPTARRRNVPGAGPTGGYQMGALGVTPGLLREVGKMQTEAVQGVSKAFQSFESEVGRVMSRAADWRRQNLPFSSVPAALGQKTKDFLDRWVSRRMMSDNVPDADRLDEMLTDVADRVSGLQQRANDEFATPIRGLSNVDQAALYDALKDPAKMTQLVRVDPQLAKLAKQAKGNIRSLTQQILSQQYAVEQATFTALSDTEKKLLAKGVETGQTAAERRLLADLKRAQRARDVAKVNAINQQLSAVRAQAPQGVDALASVSRAKLIAQGALVKDGTGWRFKDPMLQMSAGLSTARDYLGGRYSAFEGSRGVTAEQVLAAADEAAKHDPSRALSTEDRNLVHEILGKREASQGGRDLDKIGMLLQRRNLSAPLRAALGELGASDPGYLVAKTVSDMERHVALSQMRSAIAEDSRWVAPVNEGPAEFAARTGQMPVKLDNDVSRYGVLADRWVNAEIADVLHYHYAALDPSAGERMLNGWKWLKTVASPASHARQLYVNLGALDVATDGFTSGIQRGISALKSIAEQDELYREFRDVGGLNGSFHNSEVSTVLHRKLLQLKPEQGSMATIPALIQAVHSVAGKLDGAWEMSDNATRLGVFGWARSQGMDPKQALAYTRHVTYDASKLSRLERLVSGRGISRTLAAPNAGHKALDFVSLLTAVPFATAQMFGGRRGVQQALGIKMGSWLPGTDMGAAIRYSKYWLLPTLLAGYAGEKVLESRKERDKPVLDRVLPVNVPLPDPGGVVSTFLGSDGKPQFLDLAPLVNHGEFARVVMDQAHEGGDGGVLDKLGSLSVADAPLNPLVQLLFDVKANKDSHSGFPVYNPSAGSGEQWAGILGQATRTLGPSWTPGILPAMASGDVRDVVKEGGSDFARVAAGLYNSGSDAVGYYTGQPSQHMQDSRFKDMTLARALLHSGAGVRTYQTDLAKSANARAAERHKLADEENAAYRRLQREPDRSAADRANDAHRHTQRLRNITSGEPRRLPALLPTPATLRDVLLR